MGSEDAKMAFVVWYFYLFGMYSIRYGRNFDSKNMHYFQKKDDNQDMLGNHDFV